MRIVIFGTGAMACLFASRLIRVAPVTLVGTWAEAIHSIRERGILFEDNQKSQTVQVGAEFLGKQILPAELAIILVKSVRSLKEEYREARRASKKQRRP